MKKPSLISIVGSIKQRPGMYLSKVDIHCLHSFINGVMLFEPDDNDLLLMHSFQSWIQKKYRIETSHSWANIISFYNPSDNREAIEVFFEEFQHFTAHIKNEK
jgi:D-serine dehydratase